MPRNDDMSLILAKAKRSGFFEDVKSTEIDFLKQEAKEIFNNDSVFSRLFASNEGNISYTAPSGTVIVGNDKFRPSDGSRPFFPKREIAAFGHSMMEANGGIITTELAYYLGIPTYNLGIGGNTSTEIAIRSGGIIPLVTFTGGNIPADTSAVAVTVQPEREYLQGSVGSNPFTYTGTILGIAGSLVYSTANRTWTFARTAVGSLTAVPANTPFIITSNTYKDCVNLIWPERNNWFGQSGDLRNVIRDVDAIIGALTPYVKRYLVLAGITASDEYPDSPSASKRRIHAGTVENNELKASLYDKFYYDLFTDFRLKGLSLAEITPTDLDYFAISNGTSPWSLMNGAGDHPNDAGYRVIAQLVARYIASLDWGFTFRSYNLLSLNQSSIETDSTGWQGNGDAAIEISRSLDKASVGNASLKVKAAPSGISNITTSTMTPVTPGLFYAGKADTSARTVGRGRSVEFYFYNSSSGFVSYVSSGVTTVDNTSGWTTHKINGVVAPAGAAYVRLGVSSSGALSGEEHYVDRAMISQVASAGAVPRIFELPAY